MKEKKDFVSSNSSPNKSENKNKLNITKPNKSQLTKSIAKKIKISAPSKAITKELKAKKATISKIIKTIKPKIIKPKVVKPVKVKKLKPVKSVENKYLTVEQELAQKKLITKTHVTIKKNLETLNLDQILNIDLQNESINYNLEYTPPKNSLSELIFQNKKESLVRKLKNTNPNIRDSQGQTSSWTPLYWSVKLNRLDCVKILLDHGADINMIVNDLGECYGTVLDLATLRGDEIMENLLREYAKKEDINFGQSFRAIRTKLRGKAPAFNFRYYGKNKREAA